MSEGLKKVLLNSLFHCSCLRPSGCPVYPYFPFSGEGEKKEGHLQNMGEQGGKEFPDVGEYLYGHGQSSQFGEVARKHICRLISYR